jgi:hypothetical protein
MNVESRTRVLETVDLMNFSQIGNMPVQTSTYQPVRHCVRAASPVGKLTADEPPDYPYPHLIPVDLICEVYERLTPSKARRVVWGS